MSFIPKKPTFKNKTEKEFWISCIRHTEEIDKKSNTKIEAKWHCNDYIDYADKMLLEFQNREKNKNIRLNK